MLILIDIEFFIGEIVYLKTDVEALPRVVTSYTVSIDEVIYTLACGDDSNEHYAVEIVNGD
jgi:hypothetical protein